MSKAENYLNNRLSILYEEKQILISKIRNFEIEMKEVDSKIEEMKSNLDVAFEIFSPRTKKNDFIRTEIESLVEKNKELQQTLEDLQKQYSMVEGDISIIKDALNIEESVEEENEEQDDDNNLSFARQVNDGIRILEQQEYEKQRIARDLHDSSIQVLTNLVHKCEICSRVINVDSTRAKLELEVMAKALREVIDELRDIVYNLRPMSFEDIGFSDSLKKEISKLTQFSDVYVSVDIDGEYENISSIILLTIIRVVMEATSNSLKHSKCNNINIDIRTEEDNILINVEDDGIGFDIVDIHKPNDDNKCYFGLNMMKERIMMLEGNMEITSEQGKGTKIICSVPV